MADVNYKYLTTAWSDPLQTGKDPSTLDITKLIFGLPASAVRLNKLGDNKDDKKLDIDTRKSTHITLLTKSLLQNCLNSLEELEVTPLKLVSGIHKATAYGCYLTL